MENKINIEENNDNNQDFSNNNKIKISETPKKDNIISTEAVNKETKNVDPIIKSTDLRLPDGFNDLSYDTPQNK